ncbi:MAG: GntR family transcriptional regulator [Caulobacter sp.]|nr:GntR family transcriptional regulator [Caulobacter sp.]
MSATDTRPDDTSPGQSRVEACIGWVRRRIDGQVFRTGARLPSVRELARLRGVSPFTAAAAYDQLVAMGLAEARRGSGFYVLPPAEPARPAPLPTGIDLNWLMRHMLDSGRAQGPGLGVLPASWLDGSRVAEALRALGRQGADRWLAAGSSHGFEPLRQVLQRRLAALDIVAGTEQIVLTTGVTQGLDLVLRSLVRPGEAVLVTEPCWFGALGMLAAHGVRIVPVPCTPAGPDLAALERIAGEVRPRLMVLSATAHNPTGFTLPAQAVDSILAIARTHDFAIFEDDIYADLGSPSAVRLAARDGLDRVIYAGGFSKTLAANVRVGFLVAGEARARTLTQAKILTGFTTPEINERLVHRLLVEGGQARHVAGLRTRLAESRERMLQMLDREGVPIFGRPDSGMFLWVDTGRDTNLLAAEARGRGLLVAPGSLFSADQRPSTWMRLNVTTAADDRLLDGRTRRP